MKACLARVRKRGDATGAIFLLPASFVMGNTPKADLWINHRALDGIELPCRAGRIRAGTIPGLPVKLRRDGRSLSLGDEVVVDLHRLPLLIPALVLSVLVLCLCLPTRGWLDLPPARPAEQDWTPLSLPCPSPRGYCAADRLHPEGVRFEFPPLTGEKARLVFSLGGMRQGEVEVSLDDVPLSAPIPVPRGWGEEVALPLPVPAGKGDAPRFIDMRLRGKSRDAAPVSWSVRGVRILPGLPPWAESLQSGTAGSLLACRGAGGPELANAYMAIPPRRVKERTEIETAMKARISSDLVRLRSLQASGQTGRAELLREEITRWVPAGWQEGWRAIHDIEDR